MEKRQVVEGWKRLCGERDLKSTASRRAILTVLTSSPGHLTLMEIFHQARRSAPRIGVATVYRTMRLLEEGGLVKRHHFRGEASRYEASSAVDAHDHLICQRCETIVEFAREDVRRAQAEVALQHGFQILSLRHELYGLCRACRPAPLRRSR